ncbi:GGDEF domain-containing protein [Parvibium lacunae]|uniref:GGDEF domain-containing protein n=1 Tax=Parvibium lacunae TaxID=1888893 RepID=A0A368L828_9BURK|nr:GGDEF domain-containing protein [Parvibium lacunae]RCS59858.1 GGDEF domain-containing protein [Parvibium lacunae]
MVWLLGLGLLIASALCGWLMWRLRQQKQQYTEAKEQVRALKTKIEQHRKERSGFRQALDRSKLESAQLKHSLDDALSQSNFLAQALESVDQPMVAVNLRQQQTMANLACIRLYGYPANVCESTENPFLERGTETAHLPVDAWRELNLGHLYWGTDSTKRSNGKAILIERRVTPIMDAQGLAGYISLESDVTSSQCEQIKEAPKRSDYDVLTGLLNREAMTNRLDLQLQRAEERKLQGGGAQSLAVARIDLLNLRKIAHEHGQGMTDALLIEVAQRIRGVIRAGDYAARLNHDQLAVVFHRVIDKTLATELCIRLKESIETRYEVGAFALNVEAGLQISLYPEDGASVDSLLQSKQNWATV